jgi:hypothetical protein
MRQAIQFAARELRKPFDETYKPAGWHHKMISIVAPRDPAIGKS